MKKIVMSSVLAFALLPSVGEVREVSIEQRITGLYVAYFGRAGDQGGINFWKGQANTNSGDVLSVLNRISAGFSTNIVFTENYSHLSNRAFVEAIYKNALGLSGDNQGIDFWTGRLNSGMTRSDMVAKFIDTSLTVDMTSANFPDLPLAELSAGQTRQDLITNQVAVAAKFTEVMGSLSNPSPNVVNVTEDPAYKASICILDTITESSSSVSSIMSFLNTATIPIINARCTKHACTRYNEIDADIMEDTVFDGCYKITRDVLRISEDALLTVKPGSTILFLEGGGINVDGALNAVGTISNPILFTAQQKTAGFWKSIKFRGSNDTRNEIAHTIIEYAGDTNDGALTLSAGYGDSRLKLSNTTIKYSASYGFYFAEGSKIDKFENVTSTKNTKTAGVVYMDILGEIDTGSDFTGNFGNDYITVTSGDVETSATWKKLSVPINIQRDISIHDNALLTLEPGVHLVFDNTKKLSTGPLGALKAIGTKSEPILFTGKQKTAGYWKGIIIGSDSTNNILENTIIEYAGEGSSDGALELFTHYSASSGARVSITSSTIRHNSSYGIYVDSNEDSTYNNDIESSNTFINNENGVIGYN